MQWNRGWRRWTRLWRPETATNVDDELRFHFEQKVAEFVDAGMSEPDARARSEAEFGDVATVRRTLTEIDKRVASSHRRAEWWESVAQDLRYVMRSLRRSPVFVAMVIVTMALGLGANAAIFSLLDRLYLQPPPGMTAPQQVSRLYQRFAGRDGSMTRMMFNYPEVRAIRESSPPGVEVAAYSLSRTRLGRDGAAAEVSATQVEGDYFRVAGVRPRLGRFFSSEEYGIQGTAMVAVISHALWQRVYLGDPEIIGKTVDLAAHRHVIIGVAGPEFRGMDLATSDVWVPLNTRGNLKTRRPEWYENKGYIGIVIMVRSKDEAAATVFEARAGQVLRAQGIVNDSLAKAFRGSIAGTLDSQGKSSELAISTRLAGVAMLILLIACANVINLLLARVSERRRELALRLALGISRSRLITQLVGETVVLALGSAGAALYTAHIAGTALRSLLLPDVQWGTPVVYGRLALFTVAVALGSGLLMGLIPALQFSRPDLSSALKSTSVDQPGRWLTVRSMSLIAQTGLAVVLLAGAGMFLRSLQEVQGINIGFDAERLIFASVEHDRELENHSAEIQQSLPEVAEQLRRLPGVEAVSLAAHIPMYDIAFANLFLPDRDSLPSGNGADRTVSVVDPGYFNVAGIRVLRGRDFDLNDREGGEPVVAVSEPLARNLWPGEDALTKCLIVSERANPCRRVIAVVTATHFSRVVEAESMQFYLPLAQAAPEWTPRVLAIRTVSRDVPFVRQSIEREIRSAFGNWARPVTRPMPEILNDELRPWRIGASLFAGAGLLALLVAAVGVYCSITYSLTQRTREMGVRVALGASASSILQLVVHQSVRLVAIGVGLGVLVALAAGSLVASILYATSPRDPVVLAMSAVSLLVVAVVASALPAWRASRVDPLTAMRAE